MYRTVGYRLSLIDCFLLWVKFRLKNAPMLNEVISLCSRMLRLEGLFSVGLHCSDALFLCFVWFFSSVGSVTLIAVLRFYD